MPKNSSLVWWSLLVPKDLDKKVREAIKRGYYASKSDLIRDAVRKIIAELEKQRK